MQNQRYKKIKTKIQKVTRVMLLFTFIFLPFTFIYAATLETTEHSAPLKIGEEFSVAVRLSTDESAPINAFSITVLYPTDTLVFVGSDENHSIVPLWVQKPKEENGHITIEGAIPGGFTQVLDPLTQVKSAGLVTSLIFRPIKSGAGYVRSGAVSLYLNDGTGTSTEAAGFSFPFVVNTQTLDSRYAYKDAVPPLSFSITVQKSDLLFDNNYFIVFSAIDKDSGIDHYEIREGNHSWVKGESPYKLTDQSLSSTVRVKAFDKGGNSTVAILPATHTKTFSSANLLSILALAVLLLSLILTFVLRKRKNSGIQ